MFRSALSSTTYFKCIINELIIRNVYIICYFSTELKGLGPDFVFGFVQSMDGERDPRNLLLAFHIAKNILLQGYDLGEDAYLITSRLCFSDIVVKLVYLRYFPVCCLRYFHRGAV